MPGVVHACIYERRQGLDSRGGHICIPTVLTPMTGIKVRSSDQAVKLEMIKQSRCLFMLLNQGQLVF